MPLILPRETESEIESWRSNHALSDQTERRICALIDQATTDMDLLLCEVSEPRKSLVDLEQRVENDTARIKDLRAVITGSRFKRLPPEIMIVIFMHCCSLTVFIPPKLDSFPWILGHVCAYWRQILWSSTSIWNNLHITLRPGPGSLPEGNLKTRKKRWDKVAQESLNYIISQTNTLLSLSANSIDVAFIWDIIISHNHRFRDLNTGAIGPKAFFCLVNAPLESFKSLETLDMQILGNEIWRSKRATNETDDGGTITFQIAPNLREFRCSNGSDLPDALPLVLPWINLTQISTNWIRIPASSIHATLQSCPNLVFCRLEAFITMGSIIPNAGSITLPMFEHLEIRVKGTIDWEQFFHQFSFPALKLLYIGSKSSLGPFHPFASLIIRSACILEHLSLVSDDPFLDNPDPNFLEVARRLGSVKTLYLCYLVSKSMIRHVLGGSCPSLCEGFWVVDPERLGIMLDWADSCLAQGSRPAEEEDKEYFRITVSCLERPGFAEVLSRYQAQKDLYMGNLGLFVRVDNDNEDNDDDSDNSDYMEEYDDMEEGEDDNDNDNEGDSTEDGDER